MTKGNLVQDETMHRTVSRADAVRQALLLTYITLGWMTIEGAASLLLGWTSKSLLLEAFGIDSVIELFSAAVLLWRLRIEASGTATSEHVNFRLRIVYCQAHHRHARKRLGHSHRTSRKNWNADPRGLQIESRSSSEFPRVKS